MEDMRRQEVRELARLTAPLTAAQQAFFQGEYGRHRRNPTTALLLCLLLGGFGAHYFYFGRHRAGLLRLVLCWTLVPAVMALSEARTIGARAMRYNASLANELLLALRDTVHEQPRAVDALETLSTPMALPGNARAALYAPAEPDAANTAEEALIAAAYAGRESVHGAAAATTGAALAGASNRHNGAAHVAVALADGGSPSDAQSNVSHPQLPASEYDTWFDHALHVAPEATTNGHSREAQASAAGVIGPDAPQWVPLPEWHAPDTRPQRPDPADDWSMPDLDDSNRPAVPTHPQIAAADLLDGTSFGVRPEGERADWPSPAVAAAAAGAAAWAEYEHPAAHQALDEPAPTEREPVFMYQAAPAARRPAVHLGPPSTGNGSGPWAPPGAGSPALPRRLGDDTGLASLGSLLAAGLADLLRDRPEPLRTRPLTQPPAPQSAALAAPGAALWEPAYAPPPEPEDPWAVSASIRAPLAESPHLVPESEDLPLAPDGDAPPPTHHDWFGAGAAGAALVGGAALGAGSAWAHDSAQPTSSDTPAWLPTPPAEAVPVPLPEPAPSPATAPSAYASAPSQGLRRRITHRLFVRKMAVLDGRVVAESSVERQVELVDDDAIMAERVHQATRSAAREALENLLQLAPPEALPAIRAQLRSLDLEAS